MSSLERNKTKIQIDMLIETSNLNLLAVVNESINTATRIIRIVSGASSSMVLPPPPYHNRESFIKLTSDDTNIIKSALINM